MTHKHYLHPPPPVTTYGAQHAVGGGGGVGVGDASDGTPLWDCFTLQYGSLSGAKLHRNKCIKDICWWHTGGREE